MRSLSPGVNQAKAAEAAAHGGGLLPHEARDTMSFLGSGEAEKGAPMTAGHAILARATYLVEGSASGGGGGGAVSGSPVPAAVDPASPSPTALTATTGAPFLFGAAAKTLDLEEQEHDALSPAASPSPTAPRRRVATGVAQSPRAGDTLEDILKRAEEDRSVLEGRERITQELGIRNLSKDGSELEQLCVCSTLAHARVGPLLAC